MERSLTRSIGLSVVYISEPDGSLPKKRLIFYPISMITAKLLEPKKDISYEGDKTKLSGKYLFLPYSPFKVFWDFIVLMIIILQGVYVPLLISFDFYIPIEFIYFDFSVTCLLLADILINFNSGFLKKGAVVMNRYQVFKHYLKSWFFIDLISSFPYDWILNNNFFEHHSFQEGAQNMTKAAKLLRVVQISRLFKIIRLVKMVKVKFYLYKIEDYLNSEFIGKVITSFRIMTVIFLIAHWNACIWYFFTRYYINEETWLNSQIFSEYSEREAYVFSLYWSVYTMISVGYGNIPLKSTGERIIAIFSMLIASVLFGFLVGEASSIIQKETLQDSKYRELRTNLNLLMNSYKVPEELKQRVRKYVEFTYETHWNTQREADIINSLSLPLREEISHIINWPAFQHCQIFPKNFKSNVVESLAYFFEKLNFSPFDQIIKQNELERKIFFIIQGEIDLFVDRSKRTIKSFKNEGYFGEIGFFANHPRSAGAISIGFSEILALDYEKTWKLMERFPDELKILEDLEKCCKDDLCILDVRCAFCNKLGHTASKCFELNFNEHRKKFREKWTDEHDAKRKRINIRKYMRSNVKRRLRDFKQVQMYGRAKTIEENIKKRESLREKILTFVSKSSFGSLENNDAIDTRKTLKYEEFFDSDSSDDEFHKSKTYCNNIRSSEGSQTVNIDNN
jgi:hypothetical protein